MKSITKTLLVLLVGLFLMANCRKDETLPVSSDMEDRSANGIIVQAGVHDSNFVFQDFNPSIAINMQYDSQNLYGQGTDSIDIDQDGVYDLVFELRLWNQDSVHLLNGQPNPFRNLRIRYKSNIEIADKVETVYAGLGTTAVFHWADSLAYEQVIDSTANWYSNNSLQIDMWGENPGSLPNLTNGAWYAVNGIRYVGVRMNGNKYGWVAVDITNRENPLIKSCAIEN